MTKFKYPPTAATSIFSALILVLCALSCHAYYFSHRPQRGVYGQNPMTNNYHQQHNPNFYQHHFNPHQQFYQHQQQQQQVAHDNNNIASNYHHYNYDQQYEKQQQQYAYHQPTGQFGEETQTTDADEERPRIRINFGLRLPGMRIQMPKFQLPAVTVSARFRQPNRPQTISLPALKFDTSSKISAPGFGTMSDENKFVHSYDSNTQPAQSSHYGEHHIEESNKQVADNVDDNYNSFDDKEQSSADKHFGANGYPPSPAEQLSAIRSKRNYYNKK